MSIHIFWQYFRFRLVPLSPHLWQLYADVIGSKLVSESPKTLLAKQRHTEILSPSRGDWVKWFTHSCVSGIVQLSALLLLHWHISAHTLKVPEPEKRQLSIKWSPPDAYICHHLKKCLHRGTSLVNSSSANSNLSLSEKNTKMPVDSN